MVLMNDCVSGQGQEFDLDALLVALDGAVDDAVIADPDSMTPFTRDWTGRFGGPAVAVVRPSTTSQVSAAIKVCAKFGVAVLTQGGNTGLVGGSVPASTTSDSVVNEKPTVILSTTRLVSEQPVDQSAQTVLVGSGVTVARLQQLAADSGLYYGVDLASRDSATIGGTVATNAGGIRVCAYGMTRTKIRGLEAVLANGDVVSSMRGLPKDNTGYDLNALLCGSEGTLAVITQVLLQLDSPPGKTMAVLLGVDGLDQAHELFRKVGQDLRVLAAEVFDRQGAAQVCSLADLSWPLRDNDAPYLMLLEWESNDTIDDLDWLSADADAVVASNPSDSARLWTYRERQSEAAQSLPDRAAGEGLIKLDVSLPFAGLGAFDTALRAIIAPEKLIIFGHIGDGNLHIEIAAPLSEVDDVTHMVLEEVGIRGGSISGEHGVGRAKAKYLGLSRSAQELTAMKAIKNAMDPEGLLAPGIILQ